MTHNFFCNQYLGVAINCKAQLECYCKSQFCMPLAQTWLGVFLDQAGLSTYCMPLNFDFWLRELLYLLAHSLMSHAFSTWTLQSDWAANFLHCSSDTNSDMAVVPNPTWASRVGPRPTREISWYTTYHTLSRLILMKYVYFVYHKGARKHEGTLARLWQRTPSFWSVNPSRKIIRIYIYGWHVSKYMYVRTCVCVRVRARACELTIKHYQG